MPNDPNYSPAPSSGGMTIDPDFKTTRWSIACGIMGGGGKSIGHTTLGIGGLGVLFNLTNLDTGYSWPYVFMGGAVGAGIPFTVTVSAPGSTPFITSGAIGPDTFNSWGSIKGASFTVGLGGSVTWLNIWSVDHSPSPINVGGLQVGVSGGIDGSVGRFMLLKSLGKVSNKQLAMLDPNDIATAAVNIYQSAETPSWLV